MTAEIVNLRRVRKAKARAEDAAQAAENRVKFGRTKAEKQLSEAQRTLETRQWDGHRKEDGPSDR